MLPLLALAAAIALPTPPAVSTASANVPTSISPGINVSGCEFADNAALCPTAATIDAYADMGFTAMRIPVMGRQLAAAIPKLQPAVAEALKRNVLTVIDLHDYLPLDAATRVPLIKQVAAAFGPNVWIDYDNEPENPTGATGDTWVDAATATNQIIAGARAAGVTNTLVVEWPSYSANYRFPPTEKPGAVCGSFGCGLDRVGGLQDPLGKSVLGPHRYYDSAKSGTSATCGTPGWYWDQYFAATEARGYKTLIGEGAYGNAATGVPASCAATQAAVTAQIAASKLTVADMTWGGGGAWKAGYIFTIPPTAAAASSVYVQMLTGR